jgi:hypothetical protein
MVLRQTNSGETAALQKRKSKRTTVSQSNSTATMGDAALAVVAAEEDLPRSEYELQMQTNIAQNKRTLIQLGLDKPAITQKAAPKPKPKPKAKTPSAAVAAGTTVALRVRKAPEAAPEETGKKRARDPTEAQRAATAAVQNLSRRRLDSTERASRSLRERASPSHTACVLGCSCSSGQPRLVSYGMVRLGRLGEGLKAVEELSLGKDGRHRLRRLGRTVGYGPRWEVLRRLRRPCNESGAANPLGRRVAASACAGGTSTCDFRQVLHPP